MWDRRLAGESNRAIGRRLVRSAASIRAFVESSGGVRLPVRHRSIRQLSLVERKDFSREVAAGESLRVLARRLGRSPSTLSQEAARNGGRGGYRAHRADQAAWRRAHRPKACKLASIEACVESWESCLRIGSHRNRSQAGWHARTLTMGRCA